MNQFYRESGSIVEPACGAALAAIYSDKAILTNYERAVVIVCGGSSWGEKELASYTENNISEDYYFKAFSL